MLWVLGGLGVVFGSSGRAELAVGAAPCRFLTSWAGSSCSSTAVGIVLLALKPSNEWYRYRGWLRATGQPG